MDIDLCDWNRITKGRNEQNIIYGWNTYHHGGAYNGRNFNNMGKIY